MTINSVLIANRGEVAVRIIRACRQMGRRAIAVYSEADAGALWTRMADEAVAIGPTPARDSYLCIERLIEAAQQSGADAVHPGYGLLSESAKFASAVAAAGLRFIGPSPAVIAMMGDKVEARKAAIAAGLPVLPGSDGVVESVDDALKQADLIGWPIAVKASFGGGGRGMRVAHGPEDLRAAMEQASREASAAFGRGDIYLEHYLARPRHVEVQVLGDCHDSLIHLGDRDCSVQRRHQKLIEEAPAPALPDGLRTRILEAAVSLARSVGYQSAGTVEFLADVGNDAFYFLEMNTRLQVEHGVSELVTGVDIVCAQIRIADNAPIGLSQTDIVINGVAVQARIAAEDPWEGFRPTPGRVDDLKLPTGPWLRLDFGVESGDTIPNAYDSMFGKVQSWGRTREEARTRLSHALDALSVSGPASTAPYLRQVLNQPDFINATHDTGSVERDWAPNAATRPLAASGRPQPSPPTLPSASTRKVTAPWGGQLVEVAVFGLHRTESIAGAPSLQNHRQDARLETGRPEIVAPMDAAVAHTPVAIGQSIAKGAPVVVLEAMKMEVVLPSPHDGVLEALNVQVGDCVHSGFIVAIIRRESKEENQP